MRRAVYYVAIDGRDVSETLDPVLISLTIKLTAKSRADSCEVTLDDRDAQILMPRTGAKLEAGIAWDDGSPPVQFEGEIDRPTHTTGRGQGDILTISAQSAERKGKLKDRQHSHHDKGKLSEVAQKFGKAAGVSVKVHQDLGSIERDYWSMHGETFLAWGARIAREVGATFKVIGAQAVLVPRGAGVSASGKALQTISVVRRFAPDGSRAGNHITSSLSPVDNGPEYQKLSVRWYDRKEAKWKAEEVEAKAADGVSAKRTTRWTAPNKAQAKARAGANGKDSEREKGGGTVQIDGEPAALPEANATVSGVRPGLDGSYRIDAVDHSYSRNAGFTTTLTLKQPQSGGSDGKSTPGTDSRGGSGSAGDRTAGLPSGAFSDPSLKAGPR